MRTNAPGALGVTSTRVLLLVMAGHTTYADLLAETGLARSSLQGTLSRLRAQGLVTWEDGKQGMLRACVYAV